MKIGIHKRKNSFSDSWIKHCDDNEINYKIINCYSNDIINVVKDCTHIMWHFAHDDYRDQLIAKQLIYIFSNNLKIKTFPNYESALHFDNKISQKYLFDSYDFIKCPDTKMFYSKDESLDFVKKNVKYPRVFKLSKGAGSMAVRLLKSRYHSLKIIKKMFSKGISQYDNMTYFKNAFINKSIKELIKSLYFFMFSPKYSKLGTKELGYFYSQDFIGNIDHDIRIIVIGDKAIGIKRIVRNNDFRASGSGLIDYDISNIDLNTVEKSFEISRKLKFNCMAYDYVKCREEYLLVEISYGFSLNAYNKCEGFWDENLKFSNQKIELGKWMVKDLISG